MTQLTAAGPEAAVEQRLAELVDGLIAAAQGPIGRALLLDRIAERMVAAVGDDTAVSECERASLLRVLDAADEHCQRMGAFTS